jgi:hypothetical protein
LVQKNVERTERADGNQVKLEEFSLAQRERFKKFMRFFHAAGIHEEDDAVLVFAHIPLVDFSAKPIQVSESAVR